MTDEQLLELAAKAYGVHIEWVCGAPMNVFEVWSGDPSEHPVQDAVEWNPIDDDGDALRLTVKLKLRVFTGQGCHGEITTVCFPEELDLESVCERHNGDPYTATRLAITRAAALIGARHG